MLTETQKLVLHDMNVRNDFFAANMLAFSNAWHRPPAFFLPQLKSLRIDVSLIARRLHKNIFFIIRSLQIRFSAVSVAFQTDFSFIRSETSEVQKRG